MPRGRKPYFTPEQDAEIEAAYQAGESQRDIAARYGVSHIPVAAALERRGVTRRRMGKAPRWHNTPEQRDEVVTAYNAGESVRSIAKRIGCRTANVTDVLNETGATRRKGRGNRRFTDETETEIVRRYRAGEPAEALAKVYDTTGPTIRKVLDRAGVESFGIGRRKFWTDERETWLIEQFAAGRNQGDLAAECGVSQQVVSARLRNLGVLDPVQRASGAEHGAWKGGRIVTDQGYVKVIPRLEDQHLVGSGSSRYVPEHRLVMARYLGRPLERWEEVHHVHSERKDDNRIENLQLRVKPHGAGMRLRCRSCRSIDLEALPLD